MAVLRRLLLALAGALSLGCQLEEATRSKEGLTVLSLTPGEEVTAVYAHKDAQVMLHAVRDSEHPDVVSARITTSAGRTIVALIGAHSPKAWGTEPDEPSVPSATELAAAKLGARELTLAPVDEPVRAAFQALLGSLDEIGAVEGSTSDSFQWVFSYVDRSGGCNVCELGCSASCTAADEGKRKACRKPDTHNDYNVYTCTLVGTPPTTTWRQVVDMYKKENKEIWTGEMVYWSQTRTRRQKSTDSGSTWTTTATWEYTNHYGGNLRTEGIPKYQTCTGPTRSTEAGLFTISSSPLCQSGYELDSGLRCRCSKHNSNDDTEYQMAQIMANRHFADRSFRCGENSSNSSPPNDCRVRDGWTQ